MSTEIRTRFAPSPTGFLHIGGVRTALYNYLFAEKHKGKFILRIEDTDRSRSESRYSRAIMEGLRWLGLDWSEGPFYQSERGQIYEKAIRKLSEEGKAYRCFCSPKELAARGREAESRGEPPGYDGRCRELSSSESGRLEKEGRGYAWRIRTPESGAISFDDIIKGNITVDAATIQDFVLVKSDGGPAYNFACAADDSDMRITHVIRGDDHISNTPKQLLIYRALGENPPRYAHLPQVHGTDGKRLSKRTGAASLDEFREEGYLPGALRNFLALLGWSTSDAQQIFAPDELKEKFDLSGVGRSPGVFDMEKLRWINGKYIRETSPAELARLAAPWLLRAGILKSPEDIPERIIEALALEKEKFSTLSEVPEKIGFLLRDDVAYDPKAVSKRLEKDGVIDILTDIQNLLRETEDFSRENLEDIFRSYVEKKQLGAGKVFHPVRVAVSGQMKGPGLFELLEFIGRDKSVERIGYALKEYVK